MRKNRTASSQSRETMPARRPIWPKKRGGPSGAIKRPVFPEKQRRSLHICRRCISGEHPGSRILPSMSQGSGTRLYSAVPVAAVPLAPAPDDNSHPLQPKRPTVRFSGGAGSSCNRLLLPDKQAVHRFRIVFLPLGTITKSCGAL